MKTLKNLKLLLAVTVSATTLATASDSFENIENTPTAQMNGLRGDVKKQPSLTDADEVSIIFEENPLPAIRATHKKTLEDLWIKEANPLLDKMAYFIPAVQGGTNNVLSGVDVVVNARPGSLADEVFNADNDRRFIQLGMLACTPYAVESNESNHEIHPSDRTLKIDALVQKIKQAQKFVDKIDFSEEKVTPDWGRSVGKLDYAPTHETVRANIRTVARTLADYGLNVFAREDKGSLAIHTKNNSIFDMLTFNGILKLNTDLIESYEHIFNLINKNIYADLNAVVNDPASLLSCLSDFKEIKHHADRFLTEFEKAVQAFQKESHRIDVENKTINRNTYTKDMNLEVIKNFRRNGSEHSGSIAIKWKNNNNNSGQKEIDAVYVMFAGTKSFSDVGVDFNFFKASIDPLKNGNDLGNNVHAGFYNAVFNDSSFQHTLQSIIEKSSADTQFYTIGHSLGAAMATISAKTIKSLAPDANVKIFTLAAPMPYGKTSEIDKTFKDIGYDNMVYLDLHNDIVPSSTLPVGCSQFGTHFTIPVPLTSALEQGSMPVAFHHFSSTYMDAAPRFFENIQAIKSSYQFIFKQRDKIDFVKVNQKKQKLLEKQAKIENYYNTAGETSNYLRKGAGIASQAYGTASFGVSAAVSGVSYLASYLNPYAYGSNNNNNNNNNNA